MAKITKKKKAPARKKSSPKKSTHRKGKKSIGWIKKWVFLFFAVFTFLFLTYLGYLDYTVRHQFEGKRWAIPARVYSSPVELYAGYQMSLPAVEDLLRQLHYRRDSRLSSEATYYRKGRSLVLKTREFKFWDQQQESVRIRLRFSGSSLQRISDLDRTEELPIFRLDPVQIGSFYPSRKEDRILIKLENTPDALVHGLIATEDRDFYHHFGVSLRAIARAMWANLRAGGIVQGGSTITQQLVKNFYLSSERSFWRKGNEAIMALILEYRYSKDEILEAYLNEIYLGQDKSRAIHGFGLGSEFYFGRPLDNLQLQQIATLVSLVRGPSYYDPRRHPERALKRRNLVLDEMQKQGFITKRQAVEAKARALEVVPYQHRSVNRYPGFLDMVRRQLQQEYKDEDLTSEGLKIFTTLDPLIQDTLEQTVSRKLNQLEKKPRVKKLETAVIVTQRDSGEIVALTGGRNSENAGFNRAMDAVRPIGSLIKPVVYLTALEYPDRYTITSTVSDKPIKVKAKKGQYWSPRNYDHKSHGDVPFHTALSKSYNLATVRIGMDIGIGRIAKTLRSLGVDRHVDLFPSMLLGASPLTPLEVAQIYQTLAGDGFATPLRSIRAVISSDGEPLQRYPFITRQTIDPAAAYITNTILQEVMTKGTGKSAYRQIDKSFNLIGKTGTTNELRDSWFAGFSGDYLSVVWIGRDDNKPAGLTGASGALQVWTALMKQISKQPILLIPPGNVENVWVDPDTGLRADETCKDAEMYPYVKGSAPEDQSPCVNKTGNEVKKWFEKFVDDNF